MAEGQLREVTCEDMDRAVPVESFTMSEAAKALGRTELTLRKWITEELIPGPILTDAVKNWRLYSVGELQVIADSLRQHEQDFVYYGSGHSQTKELLFQRMHGYRSLYI